MPLFDQLYNFARWLTQNREEAEELVQETYAKALKGFSSFQLGTSGRGRKVAGDENYLQSFPRQVGEAHWGSLKIRPVAQSG